MTPGALRLASCRSQAPEPVAANGPLASPVSVRGKLATPQRAVKPHSYPEVPRALRWTPDWYRKPHHDSHLARGPGYAARTAACSAWAGCTTAPLPPRGPKSRERVGRGGSCRSTATTRIEGADPGVTSCDVGTIVPRDSGKKTDARHFTCCQLDTRPHPIIPRLAVTPTLPAMTTAAGIGGTGDVDDLTQFARGAVTRATRSR
jgi:hypothetical protein